MLVVSTSPAHAYFDPGTGSIILQLLIGGIGGALMIGKIYWARILKFLGFRRESGNTAKPNDEHVD